MCRLIIVVKRSHLGSCTLDYGTAVGYPNCGQRVADDHARVPKSVCWLLGCIRSTSPQPEGLSNMQFALIYSVSLRGAGLVSIDVCGPRLDLPAGQCVSLVIDRSCANSPVCCRLTTPRSAPPHSKTASSICGGFLPKDTLVRSVSAVVNF